MAESSPRPLRVFLCYARADLSSVRAIYNRLIGVGVEAWFDKEKLLPGQDWDIEIRKALRESDAILVCLSHNSIAQEGYVQKEIKTALDIANEKPDGTIFIIPLRLEECNVPALLERWHWVNIFGENEDGYDPLMRSLTIRATNLGTSTIFPAREQTSSRTNVLKSSDEYLDEIYLDGLRAYAGKDWERAVLQFEKIFVMRQDYRDVRDKLIEIRQLTSKNKVGEDVELKDLYSRALNAVASNMWLEAAQILSRIKEIRSEYKDSEQLLQRVLYRVSKLEPHEENAVHQNPKKEYKRTAEPTFYYSLPSTISIETVGGVSTPIFFKGDQLPARYTEAFTTASDNQSSVNVRLFLGENKKVEDNVPLGDFTLDGILMSPKGIPQIQTLFVVSRDLILDVTATDKATNKTKVVGNIQLVNIKPPPIKDLIPQRQDQKLESQKPLTDFDSIYKNLYNQKTSTDFDSIYKNLYNQKTSTDFDDLLKNYLNTEREAKSAKPEARKGEDIKFQLFLTLEDVVSNTEKKIEYDCNEICSNCSGDGRVVNTQCPSCQGKGTHLRKKRVTVSIPAGVDTGTKIRLKGYGHCGIGGGLRGNALAIISVEPHPIFAREGSDIRIQYPVTRRLALQGGVLVIPTLKNNKLFELTIPPDTLDQDSFRIGGAGLPRLKGEGCGDLIVIIDAYDPREISLATRGRLNRINTIINRAE